MKRSRIIYWGVVATLALAGIGVSVVERNGHVEFEWRGAELMAQTRFDDFHEIAALQVFNRVLLQLQQNYVDPERLDPNTMIASSLDSLQKSVPELLCIFDKPIKEHPTQVEVKIQGQSKTFELDGLENLWEMSLRLRSILVFVQEYLPEDVKPRDLEYDAINGMLGALDPHSVILSPELYRSMMEGNRGKFGGLGIVVRMIDGVLIVVEPVAGDVPARRAGIEEGDQILSIDGTPTLNMNISEAVDLLKGEPQTTVRLNVMRKGWKKPRDIDVVRAEISIPSLESAALEDHIAYVKLKSFQGNSQSDMSKALDSLSKEMDGIHGLVLDLRGNPGGLLDQAVYIADNFLDSGNIVTTVGVNDTLSQPRNATRKTTQASYPIVVLMDSSSASASEIVAGALKNNDRALIAGDTSFGKGSVQVLYELPDKSALKLTIGQYLTPGNMSIQSVGIVPDIRLVPMLASKDDLNLYPKPWLRREESLGGHLVNQKAVRDQTPAYALRYLSQRYDIGDDDFDDDSVLTLEDVDKLIKSKPKNKKPEDDPQVRLAHQMLKRIGNVHRRRDMIDKFVSSADSLQLEEDRALTEALKERGIDWTAGPVPADLQLELHVETDRPDNAMTAGEEMVIRATATNRGAQPAFRVVGLTESTLGRANDKEFVFGKIDPGQSVTRELRVKSNRAQASRVDPVTVKLFLDDGSPIPKSELQKTAIEITTHAIEQPEFTIHYAIVDTDNGKGVGNGLLDDAEDVTVRLWVSNDGPGTAEKPLIYLKNKAPEIILKNARAETEALPHGARVVRDFTFRTTQVSTADVQLELHVYDKASTHKLVETIAFKTARSEEVPSAIVTPQKDVQRLTGPAKLHVSPVDTSNALVTLPQDSTVQRDAIVGRWSHIVAGDIQGWIASTSLQDAAGSPISPIEVETIATIPRIQLADMPHVTDHDTISISADVTGFATLKDYYIYIATEVDHEFNMQKVVYEPLSQKSEHIQTTVPLKKGLNTIRLFVRDNNKSEAYESIFVYRR